MADDRTLYMGTDHALYRARPGDDGRWRAEGVALAGLGGVRGLLIDPHEPRRWWACTADSGVLVTRDDGVTWRESNQGIDRPAGWCLARHPRTGELWYGAEPASLFRSVDGGVTWSACAGVTELTGPLESGSRPPAHHEPHVRHVALGAGGLVLAAVEDGWLLRSEDGGASWTRLRDGLDRDCHGTALLPGKPAVVLASTGAGVYRSEDAGRTFALSSAGLRHRYATTVVVHPHRPQVAFVAASECGPRASAGRPEGADGACYRSVDGGRTWSRLARGLPELMRAAPTCVAGDTGAPDSFYVGTNDGSVWLTEDGGESFEIAVEGIQGWVRHLLLVRRR